MIDRDHIQAVRPLTPAQKGMFLEHQFNEQSGLQVEQTVWHFQGDIDPDLFQQTWKKLMDRYETLRTTFVWGNGKAPYQVVLKDLQPPVKFYNWSDQSESSQNGHYRVLLNEDRRQGFKLNAPPLMRILLLRMRKQEWKMIWTHHHILLDGWSVAQIIGDLIKEYAKEQKEKVAEPVLENPTLGGYLDWLGRQSEEDAERYWKTHLGGFSGCSALGLEQELPEHADTEYHQESIQLSSKTWQRLSSHFRSKGITPAILAQGIWCALLAVYNNMDDAVYGLTVSGRPSVLDNSDRIAGMLINSVPVRIRLQPDLSFEDLLKNIRDARFEQQYYEHYTTGQIHEWSELPGYQSLYNHLLVYENYPFEEAALRNNYFKLDRQHSDYAGAQTNLPLTLMLTGGKNLRIDAVYRSPFWDQENIKQLLAQYKMAAELFRESPSATLRDLASQITSPEFPHYCRTYVLPQEQSSLKSDFTESDIKRTVRSVFEEVFGRSLYEENPNLYVLGGHSLIASKVHVRLLRQLNLEFPLRAIFEHPDLDRLGAYLEHQMQQQKDKPVMNMEEGEI